MSRKGPIGMNSQVLSKSRSLIIFVAILMGISTLQVPDVEASATSPNWTPSNSIQAFSSSSGGIVFDEATNNFVQVVFNGKSQTLIGDGQTWTQANPVNPLIASYANLIYDGSTKNVLELSAGPTGHSETWSWDGSNWTQLQPPTEGPDILSPVDFVYDPDSGKVILFGGIKFGLKTTNETWSWDGTTWTKLNPASSPPPTDSPAMAYDPVTKKIMLFGSGGVKFTNDTWSWDGTSWTKLNPTTSPPGRVGASLAFDPALGKLILFGGLTNQKLLNDTWSWNGTNWSQINTPNSPSGRAYSNLLFNPLKNELVLMGGQAPFKYAVGMGDMWTLGPKVSARSELSDLTLLFQYAIANPTIAMQTLISTFAVNLKEVGITAVTLTSRNYLGSNPNYQDSLSARRLKSVANYLNLELKKIADSKVKVSTVNGGSIQEMNLGSDGGVIISVSK